MHCFFTTDSIFAFIELIMISAAFFFLHAAGIKIRGIFAGKKIRVRK